MNILLTLAASNSTKNPSVSSRTHSRVDEGMKLTMCRFAAVQIEDEAVQSGRAGALPRNLIAVPRAGFTTAEARRYRSPSNLVHGKEKGRRDPAAQHTGQ
jgi:hypothetical protein